jgi:hypothetical protein
MSEQIIAIATYGSQRVKHPHSGQTISAYKLGYTTAAAFCHHPQHFPLELITVFLVAHLSLLTLSLLDISCVRQTGVRS